jgi:hypothetical protein
MSEIKIYWSVKPNDYDKINDFLHSNFTQNHIEYFKNEFKYGIYIVQDMWGFSHTELEDLYWLQENEFTYKGNLSKLLRKEKLKKINER